MDKHRPPAVNSLKTNVIALCNVKKHNYIPSNPYDDLENVV